VIRSNGLPSATASLSVSDAHKPHKPCTNS